MASDLEIRSLCEDDDRSGFTCGQPDLDRFFRDYAGQNQFKLHLAVTYVALSDGAIVGFATVASGSIERSALPSQAVRKRLPAYPLPVLRLARLGVTVSAQGRGVGQALIGHVLGLAIGLRDRVGCLGVVTDAKPEATQFYERLGFLRTYLTEGSLHGGAVPMFLPVDTIARAATSSRSR